VEDHNQKRITTGAQNTQIQYETRVIWEKGLTDSMVPTVTLQRFAGDVSHLGIFGGLKRIPSGKRLHNYGKSQFSMGKSTINGHFE